MSDTPPKVLPWSYSGLTAYETCPRRYWLTKIARIVKEPPTEATTHGIAVHKALEDYGNGLAALPAHLTWAAPTVDRLRQTGDMQCFEMQVGLTAGFAPAPFRSDGTWFRGVIDAVALGRSNGVLVDWKTGKPKPGFDQLALSAAWAFAFRPTLERVQVGYAWLGHGRVTGKEIRRDEVPAIWQEFVPRVRRLERAAETGKFEPRPSGLCRKWCPVGRSHCEFCGV